MIFLLFIINYKIVHFKLQFLIKFKLNVDAGA